MKTVTASKTKQVRQAIDDIKIINDIFFTISNRIIRYKIRILERGNWKEGNGGSFLEQIRKYDGAWAKSNVRVVQSSNS